MPHNLEEEASKYLFELQARGIIEMSLAAPFLAGHLNIDTDEARCLVYEWMDRNGHFFE